MAVETGKPLDAVSLGEFLEAVGQLDDGVYDYLTELTRVVPHSAHAEYYAGIVRDLATRRRLMESEQKNLLSDSLEEIARMISGLIKRLDRRST